MTGGTFTVGTDILLTQRGAGTFTMSGASLVTTPYLAMVGWTNGPATGTSISTAARSSPAACK